MKKVKEFKTKKDFYVTYYVYIISTILCVIGLAALICVDYFSELDAVISLIVSILTGAASFLGLYLAWTSIQLIKIKKYADGLLPDEDKKNKDGSNNE